MEKKYIMNKILPYGEKNTKNFLPTDAKLLSLILYSDATNVNTLGKSQLHLIYMIIGNIKNWRRNKPNVSNS